MFPIRDTIRSRSVPLVNWLIIIANVMVFFFQSAFSLPALERFAQTWALVPANIDPGNPLTGIPS